jgi:hypothetical protein
LPEPASKYTRVGILSQRDANRKPFRANFSPVSKRKALHQSLASKPCTRNFLPLPEVRIGASVLRESNGPMARKLNHCFAIAQVHKQSHLLPVGQGGKDKGQVEGPPQRRPGSPRAFERHDSRHCLQDHPCRPQLVKVGQTLLRICLRLGGAGVVPLVS